MCSRLAPTGTPGPWPQDSGVWFPAPGKAGELVAKLSVRAKLKLLSSYAGA